MPEPDDFALILDRCRDQLAEISLKVPDLEASAPAAPSYTLSLPPAPSPPPPPERLPPAPAPAAVAVAPPEDRAEVEIFPPAPKPVPAAESRAVAAPAVAAASLPAGRRGAWAALSVALVAAAVYAVMLFAGGGGEESTIALDDPAEAFALRPERGNLVVASGKELLTLSLDGKVLGRETLDAPVSRMVWDQGSLWSINGKTSAVLEIRPGAKGISFQLNHVPSDLFLRDKYLWTADRRDHAIHQYLISRSILGVLLQPLDRYELSGMEPEAFSLDESGDLWVVDSLSRRLVRLKSDGGIYKASSVAPLSPFLGPDGRLGEMALDKNYLWILAESPNRARASIRRIPLRKLDWSPAP
jgi:hypothetical protein